MIEIVTALAPIFAIIVLGAVLRHSQLVAEPFWIPCERLNYFCLFPSLMYMQVATAELAGISLHSTAVVLLGAVALGGLFLTAWSAVRPHPGPVFSSVLQGALRPNTYVGVAAATALYGQAGLSVTALAIAITIPVLNVGSILVLALHGSHGARARANIARTVLTNPVILAVVAGAITNLGGLGIPKPIASTLGVLGAASLPLGLLAVGASLDVAAARIAGGPVLQSSLVKLALVPLATYGIGRMVGLNGVPLNTLVLFNALPCTPSAYIMARLLGGDHRVAAGIISFQTAFAVLTMPLVLALTTGQ
ncbi:AEC family transporter [Bradyrhizobium sp. SZCCHNRI20481]|uniref:AEC family transporter n=1 Tax=Bradyrhizobium sp. SZCCHNRI20481 TaxID=3057286 RepID=UPI0029169F1A|nr:AEC family transporter [Bradyrhizobium sp. SZCCHNRI20481]